MRDWAGHQERCHTALIKQFQHLAAPTGDTGQRVFGNNDFQPGFFHEQAVKIAQQRATAG